MCVLREKLSKKRVIGIHLFIYTYFFNVVFTLPKTINLLLNYLTCSYVCIKVIPIMPTSSSDGTTQLEWGNFESKERRWGWRGSGVAEENYFLLLFSFLIMKINDSSTYST